METQEQGHSLKNVEKTNNSNSSKIGILKEQSGDENITDISENKQMFERIKVEETPFEIIGSEKTGWWISLGAFRLCEPQLKSSCERMIREKDWEMIINVLCAIMAGKDMETIEKATKKQA